MNRSDIRIGMTVKFRGDLARVDKINPKTIKITLESGESWRVYPGNLSEAESWETFTEPTEAPATLGTLVKPKPGFKCPYPLLVVCGMHGGMLRLAPLGGDKGRYYRGISPVQVEIVNYKVEGI